MKKNGNRENNKFPYQIICLIYQETKMNENLRDEHVLLYSVGQFFCSILLLSRIFAKFRRILQKNGKSGLGGKKSHQQLISYENLKKWFLSNINLSLLGLFI